MSDAAANGIGVRPELISLDAAAVHRVREQVAARVGTARRAAQRISWSATPSIWVSCF